MNHPAGDTEAQAKRDFINEVVSHIPNVVSVDMVLPGLPSIVVYLASAARQAIEHLIGLDRERIAHIGGKKDRLFGYQQAFLANTLEYNKEWVIVPSPLNLPTDGINGVNELLRISTHYLRLSLLSVMGWQLVQYAGSWD